MKKLTLIIATILFLSSQTDAQTLTNSSKVKWISFEEAVKLQKETPKTIFIDMYTDWCGWCKKMDQATFTNPNIATYLNSNFYCVKFDAERKDTVFYKGKKYVNQGQGRRPTHQLAIELLKGRMSYPTIVYIDDDFNVNPVGGYMDPIKIEPLLVYFAERIHKSAQFDDYNVYFEKAFHKKESPPDLVKWYSFNEAIELNKKNPKKIVIDIYSKWNKGSAIMNNFTLTDSTIAEYFNKYFYPVKLEAETTDTIIVGEQTFINEMKVPNYPHQLPIALLQGKMSYPTLVYLDDKSQIINRVNGYMTPKGIEPIIKYFAEDIYKSSKYEDFLKTFKSKIH